MSKSVLKIALGVATIGALFIPGGFVVAALGAKLTLGFGVLASAALGIVSSVLLKPKKPSVTGATRDRLFASLDPSATRKLVLGNTALATDVRYQAYTGASQEYYHQIICVASHEVESIDEIWFDSEKAWSASGGYTAKFTGYLTVVTRSVGTAANGIAIDAVWTATATLTGCAYVHLRFKLTGASSKAESPFSAGVSARITIRGKGAKVYDPRLDTTAGGSGAHRAATQTTWAYTTAADSGRNPALQLLYYLLGWKIGTKLAVGRGIPSARIDLASFITAANICDETVSLAAGGTEPRYRSDGIFSESDDPSTVIASLCAAMNGVLRDSGGQIALNLFYNDLASPVAAFTERDILGEENWKQTLSLDEMFNQVRGRYTDARDAALYQLMDYPAVTLTSVDGIERIDSFDLPLVQSASQAQRLAKQYLQRSLYRGTYTANFGARAWQVSLGNVVTLSHVGLGWTNKLFRVMGHGVTANGVTPMILQEENTAIYAWAASEVAPVVPAIPTAYLATNNPLIAAIGDANGIDLTSDAGAFTYTDTVAVPASQTLTFTAAPAITETVNFTTSPSVTLGGSGLTRTLAIADFGANRQVVVTATGATSGAASSITVVRLETSTAVAGATKNVNRGTWSGASVAYALGDFFYHDGTGYSTTIAHTSSAGSPPPNANVFRISAETLAELDLAASTSLSANTAAVAAFTNDGIIDKGEKQGPGGLIAIDREMRSRYHALIARASTLGMKGATKNLVTYSEQFDNAAWLKQNGGAGSAAAVVTANAAVAPDGTTTADRIVFNAGTASNGYSEVYQVTGVTSVVGQPLTYRAFMKSVSGQQQKVMLQILTTGGGYLLPRAFEVGADWTPVELIYYPTVAATVYIYVGVDTFNGANGGDRNIDVFVWGAQLDNDGQSLRYSRPYVQAVAATVTQAAVGTAVDALHTASVGYLDALEYSYPAWDDKAQDSNIYPADNLLTFPLDLSNAAWTKGGGLTAAAATGADGGWWTLTDVGASLGEIYQSVAAASGLTVTAMVRVKKDAVAKATRYAAIYVAYSGGTNHIVYLDTSTGEVVTSGALVSGTATDCGTYWLVRIESVTPNASGASLYVYPARGSGATLGGGDSAATTGSIMIQRPVIFIGALATVAGPSFRARLAAFEQRMNEMQTLISAEDAKRSLSITAPPQITIEANHLGAVSAGQLPRNDLVTLYENGVDVTTSATWTRTVLFGTYTGTIGAASGLLNTTALGSLNAEVQVTATYGTTTRSITIKFRRNDAAPPATGGGATGGTGSSQTSGFGSMNSTAATVITQAGDLTFTTGSVGTAKCAVNLTLTPSATHAQARNVRFQVERWTGAAWVTQGATSDSNPDPQMTYDTETATYLVGTEGTISFEVEATGLGASATGKYRLTCWHTGTADMTVYPSGNVTVTVT